MGSQYLIEDEKFNFNDIFDELFPGQEISFKWGLASTYENKQKMNYS